MWLILLFRRTPYGLHAAGVVQELEEEYEKARPLLKDALRSAGWSATPDSTYTDYCEVLQAQAAAAAEGAA